MGLLDLSFGTVIKAVWYNGGPPRSMVWRGGDGWHVTPWWDWHRYRGGKMRSWKWDDECIAGAYDGKYFYRSFEEHAKRVLQEAATGESDTDVSS